MEKKYLVPKKSIKLRQKINKKGITKVTSHLQMHKYKYEFNYINA